METSSGPRGRWPSNISIAAAAAACVIGLYPAIASATAGRTYMSSSSAPTNPASTQAGGYEVKRSPRASRSVVEPQRETVHPRGPDETVHDIGPEETLREVSPVETIRPVGSSRSAHRLAEARWNNASPLGDDAAGAGDNGAGSGEARSVEAYIADHGGPEDPSQPGVKRVYPGAIAGGALSAVRGAVALVRGIRSAGGIGSALRALKGRDPGTLQGRATTPSLPPTTRGIDDPFFRRQLAQRLEQRGLTLLDDAVPRTRPVSRDEIRAFIRERTDVPKRPSAESQASGIADEFFETLRTGSKALKWAIGIGAGAAAATAICHLMDCQDLLDPESRDGSVFGEEPADNGLDDGREDRDATAPEVGQTR